MTDQINVKNLSLSSVNYGRDSAASQVSGRGRRKWNLCEYHPSLRPVTTNEGWGRSAQFSRQFNLNRRNRHEPRANVYPWKSFQSFLKAGGLDASILWRTRARPRTSSQLDVQIFIFYSVRERSGARTSTYVRHDCLSFAVGTYPDSGSCQGRQRGERLLG